MPWKDTKFFVSSTLSEMGTNLLTNMRLKSRPSASPDIRLDGKTVIVTGSNRTIGKAVAEDLSRRGARIILACRNTDLAEAAAADIRTRVADADLVCYKLDLSSMKSIEEFVEQVTKGEKQIDILINNAGLVTGSGRANTADGYEQMLGVNYLGTALLSLLMLPHLSQSPDGRIIFVASLTHAQVMEIQWDDLMSENKKTDPFTNMDTYAHSKLCLLLFVRKFAKIAFKSGVRVYAADPGVSPTNIVTDAPLYFRITHAIILPFFCQRSNSHAAASVAAPAFLLKGDYSPDSYHFCDGIATPVSRIAQDDEKADKLWEVTSDLIKFPAMIAM